MGPPDPATLEKLNQLGHRRYHHPPQNERPLLRPQPRRIRHASGEIIVTLDADDRFAPGFVSKGVDILSRRCGYRCG